MPTGGRHSEKPFPASRRIPGPIPPGIPHPGRQTHAVHQAQQRHDARQGLATQHLHRQGTGGGTDEFVDEIKGGSIPRQFIPAVEKGIAEAMVDGGVYGFPVVDVRAACVGGKHHAVDSSEMSFKMAGAMALREAIDQVGVDLLEPISEIHVQVPAVHHGDVLGDLNSRRAQVQGADTDESGITTIHALVPTSEILRYALDLRSLSGASGSFEIDHHGYQPLPTNLADKVRKAADA